MKKLVALILSMLLFLLPLSAMARGNSRFELYDPFMQVKQGGEVATEIDLSGLTLSVDANAAGFLFSVLAKDQLAARIIGNAVDGNMLVTLEGLDTAFVTEVPQSVPSTALNEASAADFVEAIQARLAEKGLELQILTGENETVDFADEVAREATVQTVHISDAQIDAVLEMLAQAIRDNGHLDVSELIALTATLNIAMYTALEGENVVIDAVLNVQDKGRAFELPVMIGITLGDKTVVLLSGGNDNMGYVSMAYEAESFKSDSDEGMDGALTAYALLPGETEISMGVGVLPLGNDSGDIPDITGLERMDINEMDEQAMQSIIADAQVIGIRALGTIMSIPGVQSLLASVM